MKKNSKIRPDLIKRSEKIGVLDIGSNSIRLVIYKGMDRDPIPVFNEKVLCKLGEDLEKTGNLSEAGCEIAINNICLLYTSPSPRDGLLSRMPSSA